MALTRTYNDQALKLGFAHFFISVDVDEALSGGWRYMGPPGGETTLTILEPSVGIDLDEVQGSGIRDYRGPAAVRVATSLLELSLLNIAETRPGSTLFLAADPPNDPVAVGIGRGSHLALTPNLPTIMIVPEWCDLAAMNGDPTHEDWKDVWFLWRVAATEQPAFALNFDNAATLGVTFTAAHARTAAGGVALIPRAGSLGYEGNPAAAEVGDPFAALGAEIVLPDLLALIDVPLDPAAFVADQYDAFFGDPFTADGMEFVGRMRGPRNVTFATSVSGVTTEITGEAPVRVTATGGVASAAVNIMELGIETLARYFESLTPVENAGGEIVGLAVGGTDFVQDVTPRALLLRPSGTPDDPSRDIWLWHAAPSGSLEEVYRRTTRDVAVTFTGRYSTDDRIPEGARLALWGDADAAGVPITL
jgi:hypothetical protein